MNRQTFAVVLFILATSPVIIAQNSRDLFRQALAEGQNSRSKEDRWYVVEEVAKAQASHGFYDDAVASVSYTTRFRELLFADILKIRANGGDISGAQEMIALAPSPEARWWGSREVALVMVERADCEGAKRLIEGLPPIHQQVVLRDIGLKRVQSGDLDGALGIWKDMLQGEG